MSIWQGLLGDIVGSQMAASQGNASQLASNQAAQSQLGALHQAWYNLQQPLKPDPKRAKIRVSEEVVEIEGQEIFRWLL